MHIHAYQNRGASYNVTFSDANGAITPEAGDTIHCRIKRLDETAVLEFDSANPTTNGSSFTKGSPINVLRLDAQDLSFNPGTYSILFELTDDSDGSDLKNVQRGVFTLEET